MDFDVVGLVKIIYFSLSSLIRNTLNDKESLFCAFIDLEKAFDWVERDLLYLRLLTLGMKEKYIMLSNLCIPIL